MFKRSWLSIIRKPSRTAILVLILFVMANLLLAMISIKNSVDESTRYAKEKIGGIVYLQPDTETLREEAQAARENGESAQITMPTISEALASGIAESQYIKDYTYSVSTSANANSYTVVDTVQNERERQFQNAFNDAKDQVENQMSEFNQSVEEFNDSQDETTMPGPPGGGSERPNFNFNFDFDLSDPSLNQGDTTIQGINSFAFVSDVETGNMKIIDGEAFDETTENGVIISNEVAEANSIATGDTITFTTVSDATEVSFTVVGIYQTSTENFNYNTVYTNIDGAKQFLSTDQLNSLTVDNVRYYLVSASNKDAFLAETASNYPNLTTDNLILDIDDSSYQTMVGPIEHVGSFAVTVLWIVIAATVAIITLIVVINVKDRRYEMGVLLSVGARRRNILGQIFIELLLVGTIGFMLSLGTSQILAQKMGDGLLQQQISSSQEQNENTSSNMPGRGLNATGRSFSMGGQQTSTVEQIDEIDVSAGVQEYATLFGAGYLILIVAMIVPSINILRYQPKTILTGKE